MGTSPQRGLTMGLLAVTLLGTSAVRAAPLESTGPAVTALLSVASDGTHANAGSFLPNVSADGSTVAFASWATNLVAPGSTPTVNVFVHHHPTGQTVHVSQAPDGGAGDDDSTDPALSADGSVVAFASFAGNLVDGDSNGASDVFVRDRVAGRTSRVSVAPDGAQGNANSFTPSISANGRFVAFASEATGLVTGDHNRAGDVFVHDRATGMISPVSVASDGKPGNGNSFSPAISADGRFVAFASEATNLVRGDTNGAIDVFVRDREVSRTTRASIASDGTQAGGDVFTPSISADGRFVAFASGAGNLVPGDANRASDVFVHDRQKRRTILASTSGDRPPSDRGSFAPALSADGLRVAFTTDGALVSDDTNNTEDIFVYDLSTRAVARVSLASDGTEGNRPSTGPSISPDGRVVAFESLATNLVPADSNVAGDVFWRRNW